MAAGDILLVEIRPDGWSADITIEGLGTGGTYDMGLGDKNIPDIAKIKFTVIKPTYTSVGAAATLVDTVYGTIPLRKAYPNQATMDEDTNGEDVIVRVVLSSYIYGSDIITGTIDGGFYTESATPNNSYSGAITNSSTVAYLAPIGNWLTVTRQRVTADTFTLSAWGVHRNADNGKILGACKFIVTDGVTTEEYWATPQLVYDSFTEIYRTEFRADIDMTAFTANTLLDADFEMYPVVGNGTAILATAENGFIFIERDWQPRTIKIHNDRLNQYVMPICYVDPVNGDNTTGAASLSDVTARTTPVQSIAYAFRKIRDLKNTNGWTGHTNGIVKLEAGIYDCTGVYINPSANGELTWTIIRPADNVLRSNITIRTNSDTAQRSLGIPFVKFEDINIVQDEARDMFRPSTTQIWFDDVFILGLKGASSVFITTGNNRSWYTKCRIKDYDGSLGNTGLFYAGKYENCKRLMGFTTIFANVFQDDASSGIFSDANTNYSLFSYNKCYNMTGVTNPTIGISGTGMTSNGVAIVSNLIEGTNKGSQVLFSLSADGTTTSTKGVIILNNSFIGQRCNLAYNDSGVTKTPHDLWTVKNNIFEYYANKGDLFTGNSNTIGNWPIAFGVDHSGNCVRRGAFLQEFQGIKSVTGSQANPLILGYVNDLSNSTGGGDYKLIKESPAINLSYNYILSYDINGSSRLFGGSSGVYESHINMVRKRIKKIWLKINTLGL